MPQQQKLNPVLWVVIGVAILAAGVGIGLAAGKFFQPVSSTTSVSTIPSTPILSPTAVPVEEADPTADWKTYVNADQGFSIKYPSDWMKTNMGFSPDSECPRCGGIRREFIPNKPLLELASKDLEAFATQKHRDDMWAATISKINLPDGSEIVWVNGLPGATNYDEAYIVNIKNKKIVIDLFFASLDKETVSRILSTFKFLDQNQTYTCPQTAWVNCMPGPNAPQNPQCSGDYYSWAKKNCPNFQGIAR